MGGGGVWETDYPALFNSIWISVHLVKVLKSSARNLINMDVKENNPFSNMITVSNRVEIELSNYKSKFQKMENLS